MYSTKTKQKQKIRKIVFARTVNPNHVINLSKLTGCPENISNDLKQCVQNKTAHLTTRQPKTLRKNLTKEKF